MSEPITLYRDGDEVTVYAPSVAVAMQAEGWTLEPAESYGEVPFTLRDVPETYVDEAEFVNISEPAPKNTQRAQAEGEVMKHGIVKIQHASVVGRDVEGVAEYSKTARILVNGVELEGITALLDRRRNGHVTWRCRATDDH